MPLLFGGGGDSKAIYNRGGGSTGAEQNARRKVTSPCHPGSSEGAQRRGLRFGLFIKRTSRN